MVHIINLNAIYHLHSFFYLDDVNITHLDKALSTLMMFLMQHFQLWCSIFYLEVAFSKALLFLDVAFSTQLTFFTVNLILSLENIVRDR